MKERGHWVKEVKVGCCGKLGLLDIRSLGVKEVELVGGSEKREVLVLGEGGKKKVKRAQ